MERLIIDIVSIVIGCLMIVFRKHFSQIIIRFNTLLFRKQMNKVKAVCIIVGLGFIVLGFLSLFK